MYTRQASHAELSLRHLRQHYQQELNQCTACDDSTGQLLRRHRHYLQLTQVCLPDGTGFRSPVLFPRFITTLAPWHRRSRMRQIRSCDEIDIHGSELPFLNPSSPWFSLLQNECDRVGASATSLMMSRIRRTLHDNDLRETFALVYYRNLLKGKSGEDLRSGSLTGQEGPEHWIRRWLEADRCLAREIEEYLFFAFYSLWSAFPPVDNPRSQINTAINIDRCNRSVPEN
ncbi:hypothetical protein [Lelliottia amnigena]|uniref:hypothetical protein n=1 Tax=Lelliottia amnigena TaxID=61646 RepID=UPI002B221E72|nr:hypothetical protein [Lelliottia amnigena]MEA9395730.1 hypothetical protein [Lelliottia amnigena]